MVKRQFAWTCSLLCTTWICGCGEKTTEPTILDARSQPYVSDIPLPDGFDRDRRRSAYHVGQGPRVVRDIYLGSSKPILVNNFYRQRMLEYQWEEGDQQLKNGVYFLNYHKGEEACEIRIERTPGGWFGSKTQVSVDIQSEQ